MEGYEVVEEQKTAPKKDDTYKVLARKYRPQTLDELVGQEHIATIFKNAIQSNKIGHAYLLTGSRGIGKTSIARIIAKSLNCDHGPTISPCGVCDECKDIQESISINVKEIDGASNRGIDSMRDLQEELQFAPTVGSKKRIVIIDEVHQITREGFNALLKTLEDPPAHVMFIMATTDPQKVLPTILSRCQRFDLNRIPIPLIIGNLKNIIAKENSINPEPIIIDEQALYLIAKKADGGMRDALSLLEQALSYGERTIRVDKVREIFGLI
ncbi:MAG: DNA polymerase III subunit gamma/tau, partial [Candidatus Cloacimonetes bacterium]|nr:DNA polymerase III subunit gamma/tau [Candidatus Cloacimonadota bacterium]